MRTRMFVQWMVCPIFHEHGCYGVFDWVVVLNAGVSCSMERESRHGGNIQWHLKLTIGKITRLLWKSPASTSKNGGAHGADSGPSSSLLRTNFSCRGAYITSALALRSACSFSCIFPANNPFKRYKSNTVPKVTVPVKNVTSYWCSKDERIDSASVNFLSTQVVNWSSPVSIVDFFITLFCGLFRYAPI